MEDVFGLIFLSMLLAGAIIGLKLLTKTRTRTTEEFERNAANGTTMLGASMNALQELMNPAAAKAKEVEIQTMEGRYGRKRREGKANFHE